MNHHPWSLAWPLNYLSSAGTRADKVVPLTWYMLIVSIIVCVVIGVLLWIAVRRARPEDRGLEMNTIPIARGGDGIRWISVGLLLSAIPLAAALVWTMLTLAAVAGPPAHPGLVLDVTGRQWWWEVKYNGSSPTDIFETANEIHIPVGVPVLVRLHGGDVIHSFWVPQLTGKTDTIPGQMNLSWIEADKPGRYLGQCTEFCGYQHAHMQFEVVAEPRAEFDRWAADQRQSAAAPTSPEATRGLDVGGIPMRSLPPGTRHAGGRHQRSGSHASDEPPRDCGGDASQQPRQSRRLDSESAKHQAGQSHAQSIAVRETAVRRAGLPGDAEMTSRSLT